MRSITYVEVECTTKIAQRPGGEKWEYTVVKLLCYVT